MMRMRVAFGGRDRCSGAGRFRAPSQLWADQTGTAMLEFAFVGPVFFALLIAILSIALIYLVQEGLETAAESAGRLVMTGQAQNTTISGSTSATGMSGADFKNAICYGISGTDANGNAISFPAMLPPFLNCSSLSVNVSTASNYSAANTGTPGSNCYGQVKSGSSYVAACGSNEATGSLTVGGQSNQNQVMVVQLSYLWPTLTGPLGLNLTNTTNGNRQIIATQVFTTENYSCAPGATTC